MNIPTQPHNLPQRDETRQLSPAQIEAIKKMGEMPIEKIADLKIWQVLQIVIPEGDIAELAKNINVPPQTLYKWRLNPDWFEDDGSEKLKDPNGRRGDCDHFNTFMVELNAIFPPGAHFLLRWFGLQLAHLQSIQGHNHSLAILQIADEADAILEKFRAAEQEMLAWKAKLIAAVGGSALGIT